jgi:hypothetical protein
MVPDVGDIENDGVEKPAELAVVAVNEKSA